MREGLCIAALQEQAAQHATVHHSTGPGKPFGGDGRARHLEPGRFCDWRCGGAPMADWCLPGEVLGHTSCSIARAWHRFVITVSSTPKLETIGHIRRWSVTAFAGPSVVCSLSPTFVDFCQAIQARSQNAEYHSRVSR